MARSYASIALRIWADDGFRALPAVAQWLYLRLVSDTKLSLAGVTDWRPRRIASSASDMSPADIQHACEVLEAASYIVVDEDTEEVCVRSFIRNDRTLNSAKTAKGVATALDLTESHRIRSVLSHELQRLDRSSEPPSGIAAVREFMSRNTPSPHTPEGVSDGVSQGVSDRASPRAQEKPEPKPEPKPKPEGPRAKPKMPLPDDWQPTDTHRAKARELSLDLEWEAQKFKTFHQSKDNRYADWSKAFHTWLNRASEYAAEKSQPRQSAAEREMQVAAERHQRIESGQLGQSVSWDDVFTANQLERPQ